MQENKGSEEHIRVITLQSGNQIKAIIDGNQDAIPCLFVGPASIYLPSFPASLKEQICFYGVDHYWTRDTKVPDEAIQKMSIDDMIHDLESYRQALNIEHVVVMGPSALGLVAMGYAKAYPEHTRGVIAIGTPLTMHEISKQSDAFFKANYSYRQWPNLATDTSRQKWDFWQAASKDYHVRKAAGFPSPIDDYIAELKRDEPKYYMDSKNAQAMYKPWGTFNIATRKQFFKEIVNYDTKSLKSVKAPILFLLGVADGIIPVYTVADMKQIKAMAPTRFSYWVFEHSAHMPQIEEPDKFAQVIQAWMEEQGWLQNEGETKFTAKTIVI